MAAATTLSQIRPLTRNTQRHRVKNIHPVILAHPALSETRQTGRELRESPANRRRNFVLRAKFGNYGISIAARNFSTDSVTYTETN